MKAGKNPQVEPRIGGIAGWLIARWRGRRTAEPRLALVDRITLGPRQTLALVEAEGQRILVATSAEGGPAFYPLGGLGRRQANRRVGAARLRRAAVRTRPRIA